MGATSLARELKRGSAELLILALLGLAYKANVDDFRESPAMEVALEVAKAHQGQVLIVEPFASSLPRELAGFTHLKPKRYWMRLRRLSGRRFARLSPMVPEITRR